MVKYEFTVRVKIVNVNEKNFAQIPRPAYSRFNCQECFFWMGKKDGRTNLIRAKLSWFLKKEKKNDGALAKVALVSKETRPVGFIQFGPINEFETVKLFYKVADENEIRSESAGHRKLVVPKKGWCVTCVVVQKRFRHQGVALRLIKNTLRDLKKRGAESVDVFPRENPSSSAKNPLGPVALWKKAGFTEIERLVYAKGETLLRNGEEIVIMRKILK